jgi:hypothetical protein
MGGRNKANLGFFNGEWRSVELYIQGTKNFK